MSSYKSALARAQGLGSAKSGTHHWWMQRVTAAALVPLTFYIIKFLSLCVTASFAEVMGWLNAPVNSVMILFWMTLVLYHAALGLQVVFEDYVSTTALRIVLVWTVNLIFLFFTLTAFFAIFRIISAG